MYRSMPTLVAQNQGTRYSNCDIFLMSVGEKLDIFGCTPENAGLSCYYDATVPSCSPFVLP